MRTFVINGKDIIYKNETYQVILPGLDGEISVLDFHRPFLYRLKKGIVKIEETEEQATPELFPIKDGLARFKRNILIIFIEVE